jgi:hypothetical protein
LIRGLKIDENFYAKYDLSDDALHPYSEEDYYEWWCFDGKYNNGYSTVLTLHWRNGFIKPHLTTMQMYIYSPDGVKHEGLAAINPKKYNCSASTTKCDVVLGDSFCKVEDDGRYRVKMQAKNVAVDLTYTNLIPPIKRGPGFFPPPEETHGIYHGWVIAIPRAIVEGTLTVDGKVIPVKGEGYHDHNWGNANMGDGLRGWSWGRLFDDKYTIIYSWILPWLEGTSNRPELYICRGNQPIVVTPDMNFKVTEAEFDPETKKDIPMGISLSGKQGDIKFNISLKKKEIKQSGLMQKVEGLPQYYFWRFIDNYVADIEGKDFHDTVKGTTIREYMLLNIE